MRSWVKLLLFFNISIWSAAAVASPLDSCKSPQDLNGSSGSDFSSLIPFFFLSGQYRFSGCIDASVPLGDGEALQVNSFGDAVNFANNVAVKTPKATYRVPRDQYHTYYQLYVKITIWWRMEGGPPFTYGECSQLFDILRSYFSRENPNANHPAQAIIWEGSHQKIILTAHRLPYLPFAVQYGALTAKGQIYPSRPYPELDILSIFDEAISWCRSHATTSLIDPGTHRSFTSGRTSLRFLFKENHLHQYQSFAYGELRKLLVNMRARYDVSKRYLALTASVLCDRQGERLVGTIAIGDKYTDRGEQDALLDGTLAAL